jgi:hypothetical protein
MFATSGVAFVSAYISCALRATVQLVVVDIDESDASWQV